MALLDFLAAIFAAALAGMGVGGGGLFVIYLTLVRGAEQLAAQGINLCFFLALCVPSLAVHFAKRKIRLPIALLFGLSGVFGTFLGAYLLSLATPVLLRKAFGWLLLASGALALFKKKK
ncbi:MAG: sulfite exporter TauE/SafE family protein [Clostridia bacterium]|nr:sulfite exporter TauE/SafE family protein [Clostridia bacterium]